MEIVGTGRAWAVATYARTDLHQVVEQQTKGQLKHRALRRGANERLEVKDFGDLLEHPLNTPAGQVEIEQIIGRDTAGHRANR